MRRSLILILAVLLSAGMLTVLGATPANAAVVRPFAIGYGEDVFGDFIEIGNGSVRCPTAAEETAPPVPLNQCTGAQARTDTSGSAVNDSFVMRWADVDGDAGTFNSTRSTLTVPAGARVEFARLNWAGNTGAYRDGSGVVQTAAQCGSRGAAISVPAGTPESTPVRLTVGAAPSVSVPPATITLDTPAAFAANNSPQYYSAYADVTDRFAAAPTGVALPVTVANVWAPQGYNCFGGWSLVLVYAFDAPNAVAPFKRSVFVYDGHVRQAAADAPTTTTISGFRVADPAVRVGVTAYEGDFNIRGDQLLVNSTAETEPRSGVTDNYFVSAADGVTDPAVPNNFSVDAKVDAVTTIPVGATSAAITFSTTGDSYLAQNLVLSAPIPALSIVKDVGAGPYRPVTRSPSPSP